MLSSTDTRRPPYIVSETTRTGASELLPINERKESTFEPTEKTGLVSMKNINDNGNEHDRGATNSISMICVKGSINKGQESEELLRRDGENDAM